MKSENNSNNYRKGSGYGQGAADKTKKQVTKQINNRYKQQQRSNSNRAEKDKQSSIQKSGKESRKARTQGIFQTEDHSVGRPGTDRNEYYSF